MRTVGAVLIILVALILPAHADVVYTYAGDAVKGTTTGAAADGRGAAGYVIMTTLFTAGGSGLASNEDRTPSITSYSFSDGVQTLTEATSTASLAMVVDTADLPGDDGLPVHWAFTISTATDQISSSFLGWLSGLGFGEHSGCLGCLGFGPNIGAGSAGLGSLAARARPEFGGHGGSLGGIWTAQTVSVPELAILPRLPRVLKFGPGLGIEAALSTRFQHATAWGAAAMLRAVQIPTRQDGVYIDLPSVRVEVAEMCSGLQTLALMLAAAAMIAAVMPTRRRPWAPALFVAAVALTLEANALRVAGISIGLEYTMGALAREWKDWIQVGTTGLALTQLAGLGRLVARS